MNVQYNRIDQSVKTHIDDYFTMVRTMYNHPEIGFEEFKAQKMLSEYLMNEGFEVKCGVVCKTDYIAKYTSKKDGPTIGFMCEYDALPEVGHGCGHNMIAPMSIGAAVALKQLVDELGGTIKVIGTPAEENFGGKVFMSDAGVFDDVDVALMIHPGNDNSVGGRSTAINPVKFEFFGKNKDEISNTHFLAMGEYGEENGKSIQNILRVNGYIRNNKGRETGPMKKNRGYRR